MDVSREELRHQLDDALRVIAQQQRTIKELKERVRELNSLLLAMEDEDD